MSLYQIFGCRVFAHIPKQVSTKNLNSRATQGICIGLDRSRYPGYMIFSPEYHVIYITGDVVFHPNSRYDGRWSDYKTGETTNPLIENDHVDSTDKFMYLVGTNHLDPDNGLLYKITRVVEQKYRV